MLTSRNPDDIDEMLKYSQVDNIGNDFDKKKV